MFISSEGLKVVVATRLPIDLRNEQPTPECSHDPLGASGNDRRIIEDELPVCEVARGFGVSERTARKWLARFRVESQAGWATARPAQGLLPIARPRTGLA
ncbi:hypothetical protein ILT44_17800 [Microvirga sp. BT689]|nr:hypothetical protein [Microvirga arvi]